MKILKYIFIISIICILAEAARQDQTYKVDSKLPGVWDGSFISAQPQIGADPSQFFLCGFGFREMKWIKQLWNCNCNRRWYIWTFSWRCDCCDNVFWTQSNAFKGIYCHYSDWNQQIQKITETGNKDSGKWRQFKCPKNQYASLVSVRNTGNEEGVELGFNGMQIICSNANFSENSIVNDGYSYPLSQISNNKQGNFITTYKLKYEENGKLLGAQFGFEGMPLIQKIDIKYSKIDKIDPTPYTIDSVEITSTGSKSIVFNKTHTIKNSWINEKPYFKNYEIQAGVRLEPMKLNQTSSASSTYTKQTQTFRFGNQISTVFSSNQSLLTFISTCQCKKTIVSSIIKQQAVNVSYEGTVSFINRWTLLPIGTTVVKGVWNGVLASDIANAIKEQVGDNCGTKNQSLPKYALKQNIMNLAYSTAYNNDHTFPLLDGFTGTTCWSAAVNDLYQFVQFASNIAKKIVGIETQGRSVCCDQWVKKYKLSYSNDGVQFFGYSQAKQFIANSNRDTHVKNMLQFPIIAKFIRIHPTDWNNHISMRVDVLVAE